MRALATIYVMGFAATALFVGVSWLLARAVGARVTALAVGMPPVVRFGSPEVRLGPIPSGYVTLHGRGADDGGADPRAWKRLGLGQRLLVVLGPWLILLAAAMALLGPARALGSLVRGFEQVLLVVDVTPLVRRFLAIVEAAPLATSFGIVLAKMVAVNLLPLGGLAGGGMLQELMSPRSPRWLGRYLAVTALVPMLWIVMRFGWAIARVVL